MTSEKLGKKKKQNETRNEGKHSLCWVSCRKCWTKTDHWQMYSVERTADWILWRIPWPCLIGTKNVAPPCLHKRRLWLERQITYSIIYDIEFLCVCVLDRVVKEVMKIRLTGTQKRFFYFYLFIVGPWSGESEGLHQINKGGNYIALQSAVSPLTLIFHIRPADNLSLNFARIWPIMKRCQSYVSP